MITLTSNLDKLVAVVVDHKHAPPEVIGELETKWLPAYDALYPYADELVVLATCNRFEVYAVTSTRETFVEKVMEFLGPAAKYAYTLEGLKVAHHLFRVAAGLESAILGENEILGQVAKAYEEARKRGYAGKYMSVLFHYAIHAGRRVRSETRLSRGNIGYPSAAVRLAEELLGELKGKTVLVVGAGEAGAIIASLVSKKAPKRILIANRTPSRAIELARKVGGEGYGLDALPTLLRCSDVVFVAVTVDKPVITRAMLEDAVKEGRRILVVDISAKPAVELPTPPGVAYYGFKDVEEVVKKSIAERASEVPKAEKLVEEALKRFERAWRRKQADEIIAAFTEYAETVAREEAEELMMRLRHYGVDGAAKTAIESFSRSLVKKLLRPLIVYTHQLAEKGELEEVVELAEQFRREYMKRIRAETHTPIHTSGRVVKP